MERIDFEIQGVPFCVIGDADLIAAMTNPIPRSEKEFFGRLRAAIGWDA